MIVTLLNFSVPMIRHKHSAMTLDSACGTSINQSINHLLDCQSMCFASMVGCFGWVGYALVWYCIWSIEIAHIATINNKQTPHTKGNLVTHIPSVKLVIEVKINMVNQW